MAGCPYKVIHRSTMTQHATKCHACVTRIDAGIAPICVRTCPGRCIWIDYLDHEEGTVSKLVNKWGVALQLRSDFGTRPNVYYVPPISAPRQDAEGRADLSEPRIPLEYLTSLFGPDVESALETLREEMAKRREDPKQASELMDLLIGRRWEAFLGPFQTGPADEAAMT